MDDVLSDKQNNICRYFTKGRHYLTDVFYLAQTCSRVPKQLIRGNANIIILFKQDERNIRHIYNYYVK